jgi:molybdopterin converting factor small subunit
LGCGDDGRRAAFCEGERPTSREPKPSTASGAPSFVLRTLKKIFGSLREKLAEQREEREREQAAVRTEVAELLERLPELGVEERAAAIANVGERYGRWRPDLAKLQAAAAELEREADHHAAGPAAGGEADGALESGDDRDEK